VTWRTTLVVWAVAFVAIGLGIWWGASLHASFN
jgi:hypothetical protein